MFSPSVCCRRTSQTLRVYVFGFNCLNCQARRERLVFLYIFAIFSYLSQELASRLAQKGLKSIALPSTCERNLLRVKFELLKGSNFLLRFKNTFIESSEAADNTNPICCRGIQGDLLYFKTIFWVQPVSGPCSPDKETGLI